MQQQCGQSWFYLELLFCRRYYHLRTMSTFPPVCLTISVAECTGATGSQADIKTFTALGSYGAAVNTGLHIRTFHSSGTVQPVDDGLLRAQLDAISQTLPISAVKIGLIPSASLIRIVGRWLRERPSIPVVVDPVLTNQVGIPMAMPETIQACKASYCHELRWSRRTDSKLLN